MGKGIYGMKPLGGGHLIAQTEEAFNFVKDIPFIHSFAVGMQSKEEVDCNINLMKTGHIPEYLKENLRKKKKN